MIARNNSSPCAPGSMSVAQVDESTGYFLNVDDIRREEYPMLQGEQKRDKVRGRMLMP